MHCDQNTSRRRKFFGLSLLLTGFRLIVTGCQEAETVKRELLNKVTTTIAKPKKNPFTQSEGITLRPCSVYQTANTNSEVILKLPAETPLHLLDKVGELYRVRVRDGREGYVEDKVVGGQEVIMLTRDLRLSIEGRPVQAEGVIKTKANFRLKPGREEIIEILAPGKKFEIYERVVTVKRPSTSATRGRPDGRGQSLEDAAAVDEPSLDALKKDVWYKVKLEDGRVGYIYTHNMKLTPPEDIARIVPYMRMVGWRTVNSTDDPDRGAKNNFIVAYAPIGKDAGCDYNRLYFMSWSTKLKKRVPSWQLKLNGVLPITNYHSEGRPGFSVRYLHPSKKDKLVLASFVFAKGTIRKVSEEEIPNTSEVH